VLGTRRDAHPALKGAQASAAVLTDQVLVTLETVPLRKTLTFC
jgi:hypothetical protein